MTRSILALMLLGASAVAQEKREKTVILVHGAFADGSSWDKVIPLLEAKGLHVVAVQNPLTSLADDVAATQRAIDAQKGPVILVRRRGKGPDDPTRRRAGDGEEDQRPGHVTADESRSHAVASEGYRGGHSRRCGEEHFESGGFSREGMSVEGEQPVPLNLANRNCLPPRGALMTKASRVPVIGILLIGISSFDKQTTADTKRLVNLSSLPPDAEIEIEWNAFLASLSRPAARTRLQALLDRGLHKPGDVESRLGYHVGPLGLAKPATAADRRETPSHRAG